MGASFLALAVAGALLTGCWGMGDSSSGSSSGGMSSSAPSSSMTPSPTPDAGEDGIYPEDGDGAGEDEGDKMPGQSSSQPAKAAAAQPDADWRTLLVNAEHPLGSDFSVETVPVEGYDDRLFDARAVEDLNRMLKGAADAGLPLYLVSTYRTFDARAADALEAMLTDAEAAGCKLYLVSAYRSVERQRNLFARKTQSFLDEGFPREEAEKQAAQWVARPGTSEHNLGLAADIVSADWYQNNDDLTGAFEETPEFAWLSRHCVEHGFVLRYPADKTDLTGVEYEPWHYRYVGVEAARYLTENGLCLEELNA